MIAQPQVLGKSYRLLRAPLENPKVDEAKAFEALMELAVMVRLLAQKEHTLVPFHSAITNELSALNIHKATEMYHVGSSVVTLQGILDQVKARFKEYPHVLQVVAVPLNTSFPTYDFFLLHRDAGEKKNWKAVVGYQCKQGTETPSDDAWDDVEQSVWVEGQCRKYRVQDDDGQWVDEKLSRGWTLLSDSNQADLLGLSFTEALPKDDDKSIQAERTCCMAEEACREKVFWTSQCSQESAKRPRIEDDA